MRSSLVMTKRKFDSCRRHQKSPSFSAFSCFLMWRNDRERSGNAGQGWGTGAASQRGLDMKLETDIIERLKARRDSCGKRHRATAWRMDWRLMTDAINEIMRLRNVVVVNVSRHAVLNCEPSGAGESSLQNGLKPLLTTRTIRHD